ncbi:MAG TPA: LacI family DNA-binding transcriptional regulator, partial [Humibacter sp.]|nr:LacI family DNA-binding transcriptional regulator [Humibacter sp.]
EAAPAVPAAAPRHPADEARPTLAAVAARAGVSPSTASLAFSGSGPVSDATRERVLAAARELNYAGPDPRARSLRRGRSGIVGVVLEERVSDAFHDPIKIAMLDGLSERVGEIGAAVLILTDAGREAAGQAVTVGDAPMDAAVLIGCGPRLDETITTLRNRGIPVVAIEGYPGEGVLEIAQDNREATALGARHLRDLGHERVAVVTLPFDRGARGPLTPQMIASSTSRTSIDRLAGARDVFPDAVAVAAAGSFVDEGDRAARLLLDVPAGQRPTAVIAQSDLLAAGVIRAAEELGIRVPEELSVLGFDGVRVEGLWPYDLTTLVQPAVDKGRAAGRAVLQMLAGEVAQPVAFTSDLHIGNTTAPPG